MSRKVVSAAAATAIALFAAPAAAQATVAPDGIVVGSWTFRPLLEVRIRGEYRRHPIDTGGDVFGSTAVLSYGNGALPPVIDTLPPVSDQYLVAERSRVGLSVDRGPVTAAFTLQDARVFGSTVAAVASAGEPILPRLEPLDAYIDVHSRSGRKVFFRLGRQRVEWGDGRLIGTDDWSPTARALDAARLGFQVSDFDVEAMAVLLAAPGSLPPAATGTSEPAPFDSGSQLYAADVVWHLFPLLQIEATGIGRTVREPVPASLTPSDTLVADGRLFGDRRGFRYALEGAYEGGRVSVPGGNRPLSAFALSARASLETSLFWHLTFGAEGNYASGDDGKNKDTLTRFDPILPNEHTSLGPMGLFAWSNVAEVGGTIAMKPVEPLEVTLGYRFVNLADARGRWTTASLVPVGASATNSSTSLGNELDATVKIVPWQPIEIETGYGAFIDGAAAENILRAVGRPATLEHWVYLQAQVRAP